MNLKLVSFIKNNIIVFNNFFINFTILNFFFSYNALEYPKSSELIYKKITLIFKNLYIISDLEIFYFFSYGLNSFEVILIQNFCLSLLISFFYTKSEKENLQYYLIFTTCTLFVFYIFNYSSWIPRSAYLLVVIFLVFYQLVQNKLINYQLVQKKLININLTLIILIITNTISLNVLKTSYETDINLHRYLSIEQIENKNNNHNENFVLLNNNLSNILLTSSDLINPDLKIHNLKNENGFNLIEINTELYGHNVKSLLFKNTNYLSNCLFIYHRGHQANQILDEDKKLNEILKLNISRKCDVILLDMIGEGLNTSDYIFPTKDGNYIVDITSEGSHEHLDKFYFESKNGKVELTSFMVISQYNVVQYLISEFNYEHVDLFGFSGGAWSGLFISILIPGIDKVILHSGSMPIELDNYYYELNDEHKEFQSFLFQDFSYFDFYFMISNAVQVNPNRTLKLIYSDNDPCCFSYPESSILKKLISNLDIKNFDIDILETPLHTFYISSIENSFISD